jgi:hypothetical protein
MMTTTDLLVMSLGYKWKSDLRRLSAQYAHLDDSQIDVSEDIHPLVESVLEIAYTYLIHTNLEHLSSEADADRVEEFKLLDEEILIQGETRTLLEQKTETLRQKYISNFSQYNVHIAENMWTMNEEIFVALAISHYILHSRKSYWVREVRLRTDPVKKSFEALMDSRCRLAYFISRHHHLVSGVKYLTQSKLMERNEESKLENKNKALYTPTQWQEMIDTHERNEREANERKQVIERIIQEGKHRAKRSRDEDNDNDEERALQQLCQQLRIAEQEKEEKITTDDFIPDIFWRKAGKTSLPGAYRPVPPPIRTSPARGFPTEEECRKWMDEVSFFITCYYSKDAAVHLLEHEFKQVHEITPLSLSTESIALRDKLTNATPSDGAHGDLWKVEIESYPCRYVTFASQFFAQVWCERYWSTRFPVKEIHIAKQFTDAVDEFVASRVVYGVQEGVIEEMRHAAFDGLLPIGGWNMVSRIRAGVGNERRTTFFQFHGTNASDQIYEMFCSVEAIKVVGFDTSHPLYDYVVMAMIQNAAYNDDGDFSMLSRCLMEVNQLCRRAKDLEKREAWGSPRRPIIIYITGEWRVHHDTYWLKPARNRFADAFLIYLMVLKQYCEFSLEDRTDLSYMQDLFGGTSLPSLE